jgi:pimeloyl-ACP methyl ester carboxylesterase
MSRFAADHPNRVGKLVYLDAAYDRSVTPDSTPGWTQPPLPTAGDRASRSAFGAYLTGILGVEFPSEEIAATTVVAADGSVVDFVTPQWIGDSLAAGVESPPYADVMATALGIYAVPQTPADIAPWLTPSSPDWSAAETYLATVVGPAQEADRMKFDGEVQNSSLLEYDGAYHYVFLWDADQVATAVIGFLGGN